MKLQRGGGGRRRSWSSASPSSYDDVFILQSWPLLNTAAFLVSLFFLSFFSFLFFFLHRCSLLGCWEIRMENLIFLVSWFFLYSWEHTLWRYWRTAYSNLRGGRSSRVLQVHSYQIPCSTTLEFHFFFFRYLNSLRLWVFMIIFWELIRVRKLNLFWNWQRPWVWSSLFSFLPTAVIDIWEGK